ncbi:hypothetical protein G7046_g5800 [Stylonectria norvegica]|nr:hypothetical protein G7046_g5800 [Stylonectria norvegica]
MTSDRPLGGVALNHNRVSLPATLKAADGRPGPPDAPVRRGDFAVQPAPDAVVSRVSQRMESASLEPLDTGFNALYNAAAARAALLRNHPNHPRSIPNFQDITVTSSTDPVLTPPASDASGSAPGAAEASLGASSQESQLLQLSEIAAAQDKMTTDAWSSRKRMADGEVKSRRDSISPVKGHSRNTSAVSRASTTGSYIGELSADLKTRLTYAMVKVHHGWQSNSLDEVESMASQAASPTSSSTSTVHRRQGSSASPRMPMSAPSSQVPSSQDPMSHRRKSNSPPRITSSKPTLAPPAAIQPSMGMPAPRSNPRRNSNPHYTPTLLSHSSSASPHTPAQPSSLSLLLGRGRWSIRCCTRRIKIPGNSANLKHTFSPSGSPGPHSAAARSVPGRHALPSGPRKTLPSQRPSHQTRRTAFDTSPGMPPPPGSPMNLDSPQQQPYQTPNRGTPRRRINGGSSHLRGALSLPSGLGVGNGTARRILKDEDIERMLDRAGAECADSSDDEEIQLPRGRGGVAGVMRV